MALAPNGAQCTRAAGSARRNSSTARNIRFHTAYPPTSPLSSMASARMAAWIGAELKENHKEIPTAETVG